MRCFNLFFCNHLHYINKLQFEFIFIYIFSSLFIRRRNILIHSSTHRFTFIYATIFACRVFWAHKSWLSLMAAAKRIEIPCTCTCTTEPLVAFHPARHSLSLSILKGISVCSNQLWPNNNTSRHFWPVSSCSDCQQRSFCVTSLDRQTEREAEQAGRTNRQADRQTGRRAGWLAL